ncbi:MAG TPA: hypothetical protein PKA00_22705 [Saprospiraceae bacterium]|nr:hypothetical protein [Saprospiraceae bacterium]HMQ85739.1 hypothetical protein [Saprospiraceae bacterium]
MTLAKQLKQGFALIVQYRRMVLLLYVLLVLLALLVVLPFQALINRVAGHSLSLEGLLKGWDYTFWNDFMNEYGAALTPVLQLSLLAMGVYLLAMIFFLGGIFSLFVHTPSVWDRALFWGQSARFFGRMLRLSIYFWLMQAAILAAFGALYLSLSKGLSPYQLDNDALIMGNLRLLLPFYLLVAVIVLMWQDYAKVVLVAQDEKRLYRPILAAWRFVFRHFAAAFVLYITLLALLGLLNWLNLQWYPLIEEKTGFLILLSFFLSQLVLVLRLLLRLAQWSTATAFWQSKQSGELENNA